MADTIQKCPEKKDGWTLFREFVNEDQSVKLAPTEGLVSSFKQEIRGSICAVDPAASKKIYFFKDDIKQTLAAELFRRAGTLTFATPVVMDILVSDNFWGSDSEQVAWFDENPPLEMSNTQALEQIGKWATVGEIMPERAIAHIRAIMKDTGNELFRRDPERIGKYYIKADFLEVMKVLQIFDNMVVNMKALNVGKEAVDEMKGFIYSSFGVVKDNLQRAYEESERSFDRWWNTALFAALAPLTGIGISIAISKMLNKPPRDGGGGEGGGGGQSTASKVAMEAATLVGFTIAVLPFVTVAEAGVGWKGFELGIEQLARRLRWMSLCRKFASGY